MKKLLVALVVLMAYSGIAVAQVTPCYACFQQFPIDQACVNASWAQYFADIAECDSQYVDGSPEHTECTQAAHFARQRREMQCVDMASLQRCLLACALSR